MSEIYYIYPSIHSIKKIKTFPKPTYRKESKCLDAAKKEKTKGGGRETPINTQLVSARIADSIKYRRLWLTCAVSNPVTIISMLKYMREKNPSATFTYYETTEKQMGNAAITYATANTN